MDKEKSTKTGERKYRVQLDFSEEAFNEINALQDRIGASSRAEAVRSALALLRWVIDKMDDEYQIVAIKKDEQRVVEPIFPFSLIKK